MITVLRNAHVHDPAPAGRQTVLVGGGKVLWMGADCPALPAELVAGELDLEGLSLIPGLVDAHVHPTGGGGESGAASRVPAPFLSQYTSAGVTTVVGLLGTDAETRGMHGLLAQIRALRDEGISAWCYTGGYHLPPCTLTGSIRGDIVHLDAVIGVGELALSDFRSSQPTRDELLRIASEAQVAGVLTGKAGIVHLHMGNGERGLELVRQALDCSELPPRVFNPTHVNRRTRLFGEALDLARRGCTIDVTAFPVEDGEDALTAEDAIARYLEAGLPPGRITVSSDGGGCLPTFDSEGRLTHMDVGRSSSLAGALATLWRSGLDPATFLPAFTLNPARLLRLRGKGRITPGADADLVVLDADARVHGVMAAGHWHVREGRQITHGTFETDSAIEPSRGKGAK